MRVLGVFAKYWQPGLVKTRLATATGEENAAQVHQALLRCTLRRTFGCADRHVLVFTPENRRTDFADIAGTRWQLEPQRQGDLGDRLDGFFRARQDGEDVSTIVIGSDSPNLPISLIEEAFQALQRVPVVLGPSADGGYYLIGLRGENPPVFQNIEWGSPRVWEQTVSILEERGIAMHQLAPWYDVDLAEDLQRLRDDLAKLVDPSPAETELAAELEHFEQR